ncbi:MAG TPA: undecaprenyl-phosphate glucose phosphotransferase [Steroidobacteraceae bacterium]|nr:undecaprenyl-phosphate glucose phosphotransferase [Steroidobacteraceae bacterium]
MTQIRAAQRHAPGVTPWDPSSVFVLKSLLYPLAATGSLGVALLVCHEPFQHSYFLIAVIAFLATADFLDVAPLQYDFARSADLGSLVSLATQWLVVVGFIWMLITLSDMQDRFDQRVLLTWAGITPLVLWLSQLGAQQVLRVIGPRAMATRNAVIIGQNELGQRLAAELRRHASLRVNVLGFFDDQQAAGPTLGDPSRLPQFILRNDVQIVYITWPMAREARILELLETLRDSTASIYFVPDVSVANLIQARIDFVNGIPLVGVCESPFYGIRGLVKRACDIVLASVLIAVLAPVFVACAIGVRRSGPGPIVFKQRRYGLDGKEIVVYKFRSMTVTEDGDHTYTQVIRNDARVTPFGAFIRKTSLDELPQLFNVLEGSMSLVGPRPHAVAVNEQYRRLISGYMVRHKVKPGITGWAQVNGFRGGDDLESMKKRVAADLEYLRNWSLGLDFAILLKTVTLVWGDRRAF